jgi:hypothetical protein
MQDVIELSAFQIERILKDYVESRRPGIQVCSVDIAIVPQTEHGGHRVVAHAKYTFEEDQSDAAADVLGGSGGTGSLDQGL